VTRALTALFAAAALMTAVGVGTAAAEVPPYQGDMGFPAIQGPADPEEYSWEVQLGDDQELREIDDRHAAVYYTDPEHLAFGIEAEAAHDADGTTVPTTIAVTQPNIITLTVHHRDGDPAAAGASFDYPVVAGEGWDGGFQTHVVLMPPAESPVPAPAVPRCEVPDLGGRTLKASRRLLRKFNCKLGPVRGERGKGTKVAKQYRKPGRSLPAGSEVGVKLG
jgi:hypothetical protein